MTNSVKELIQTCVELGTAQTLETLGIHSGEMSARKARDTYGKYFTDAFKQGRILPWRVEDGKNGTQWFRVVDILALRANDMAEAEITWRNNQSNNLI